MLKQIFAAAALAGASLMAAPVLEVKKVADLQFDKSAASFFSDKDGAVCVTAPGYIIAESARMVPVDMAKSYKVTGKVRKAPDVRGDVFFWFGIKPFDAQGKWIASAGVNLTPENLTGLTVPAKKGDRELVVKDASGWKIRNGFELAAFNAKADGSDIPNQDVSPIISKIEKRGDHWVLSLKEPLKKDYPAGTVVRNQRHGGTYHYFASGNAPAEWKEFSVTLKGDAGAKGMAERKWWSGTRSVKLVFFMNQKNGKIEVRDLEIVEL